MSLKDLSFYTSLILLPAFLFDSCNRPSEDSAKAGKHITNIVVAAIETQPTPQGKNDDSADDPAIWIHPFNPEKSVIIGTDKKGGLAIYNLKGEQLNYYPFGDMNNCDLRTGFPINGDTIDILAASNRTMQSVSLFRVLENGVLDSVHNRIIHSKMSDEVYGLCMYHSNKTGLFYVFVNGKSGEVEQYELFAVENNVDAKLVRSFKLGPKPKEWEPMTKQVSFTSAKKWPESGNLMPNLVDQHMENSYQKVQKKTHI